MKIDIHLAADLEVPQPVPTVVQVEAAAMDNGAQTVESSMFSVEPFAESEAFLDLYGNPARRLLMPAGNVRLEYQAVVEIPEMRSPMIQPVEPDALHIPTDALIYTMPSRYCQSDRLCTMAADMFGKSAPGFTRVASICDWINEHIDYQYGVTMATTSAVDTVTERKGVCRDFAHLGIAFCRALNIPARYVSGYCLGLEPPDLHAYFHAYLDGRWVAFDATERQPRPALVQIAVGRDAADCSWTTFYGAGETKSLTVEVSESAEVK